MVQFVLQGHTSANDLCHNNVLKTNWEACLLEATHLEAIFRMRIKIVRLEL